jgi:hypothetical protein
MSMIGEEASASHHGSESSQSCSTGDQEHDQKLIFDGVYGFDARKDLTGHHPWQRDKADRGHRIDGRHQPAPDRIPQDRQQRLVPGTAKRKASFYRGPFTHHAIGQHVQAQAYTRHGVAQDHAQQRQRTSTG